MADPYNTNDVSWFQRFFVDPVSRARGAIPNHELVMNPNQHWANKFGGPGALRGARVPPTAVPSPKRGADGSLPPNPEFPDFSKHPMVTMPAPTTKPALTPPAPDVAAAESEPARPHPSMPPPGPRVSAWQARVRREPDLASLLQDDRFKPWNNNSVN